MLTGSALAQGALVVGPSLDTVICWRIPAGSGGYNLFLQRWPLAQEIPGEVVALATNAGATWPQSWLAADGTAYLVWLDEVGGSLRTARARDE